MSLRALCASRMILKGLHLNGNWAYFPGKLDYFPRSDETVFGDLPSQSHSLEGQKLKGKCGCFFSTLLNTFKTCF